MNYRKQACPFIDNTEFEKSCHILPHFAFKYMRDTRAGQQCVADPEECSVFLHQKRSRQPGESAGRLLSFFSTIPRRCPCPGSATIDQRCTPRQRSRPRNTTRGTVPRPASPRTPSGVHYSISWPAVPWHRDGFCTL